MSNHTEKTKQVAIPPELVGQPLSMRDLTTLLVRHNKIHQGRYDLMIEYHIGAGSVGPTPESRTPGIMVGISRIGLVAAQAVGPATVDAAIANPAKKKRSPVKSK